MAEQDESARRRPAGVPGRRSDGSARGMTVNANRITRKDLGRVRLQLLSDGVDPDAHDPPHVRGECALGGGGFAAQRPCPYVSCRHNLYLEVSETGGIKFPHPGREPEDVPPEQSCALDVAERGGVTLDGVGEILNVTRERTRQVEALALGKFRERAGPELLEALADQWVEVQNRAPHPFDAALGELGEIDERAEVVRPEPKKEHRRLSGEDALRMSVAVLRHLKDVGVPQSGRQLARAAGSAWTSGFGRMLTLMRREGLLDVVGKTQASRWVLPEWGPRDEA